MTLRLSNIYENANIYLHREDLIIHGWVMKKRKQNEMIFVEVNDGSRIESSQIICVENDHKHPYKQGEYVKMRVKMVKAPEGANQLYEFQCVELLKYNSHMDHKYPIIKKSTIDHLRAVAHMRPRTRLFNAIFRMRHTIMMETHGFWDRWGFLLTDPNMITTNECEGGAGVFTATELAKPKMCISDFKKDHFKKQAFLTVSSQLQLEAMCCGLGNVYTTNRSFRSEHSDTSKHLSEFTHLEIEMNDICLNDLIHISTEYLRYIINTVYVKHSDEIKFLNEYTEGALDKVYEQMTTFDPVVKTYDDIHSLAKEEGKSFEYGEDLSSELEKWIVEYYNAPVYVTHWPKHIKSFYMKVNEEDSSKVDNFDLLIPYGVGELIGGSMREDNYETLVAHMNEKNVERGSLEWYLDLRKYGTVPHGGFGLGLERLMMMCTGMNNIRDVIPFPNSYQNCKY